MPRPDETAADISSRALFVCLASASNAALISYSRMHLIITECLEKVYFFCIFIYGFDFVIIIINHNATRPMYAFLSKCISSTAFWILMNFSVEKSDTHS